MADIEKVKVAVTVFLKKTLSISDAKVIKVTKVEDAWETEVEVYEDSAFIKSLGLPTRVKDRNIYAVKMNDNLEVQSYERKEGAKSTE